MLVPLHEQLRSQTHREQRNTDSDDVGGALELKCSLLEECCARWHHVCFIGIHSQQSTQSKHYTVNTTHSRQGRVGMS